MTFDRSAFDNFLVENDCIEFYQAPIRLRSGRLSWWDANIKKLYESIHLKRQLARFVYAFAMAHELRPDLFLGVPEGAIPLGESLNDLIDYKDLCHIPATILRSQERRPVDPRYRYAVGPLDAGQHVVLVDDTIATGHSFMSYIYPLQGIGIVIDGVIVCVDRMERRDNGRTYEEDLRDSYHVNYFSLTNAMAVLPKAYSVCTPDRVITENIEQYFKQYGVTEISLL
jgi:orotate phosphoribosyltransferase